MNISEKIVPYDGVTFDDVLLLPNFAEIKREEIDISTYLTPKIKLAIPFISSPMDTVTESKLAIALAKMGGIGFIHRNLSIQKQAEEIRLVKKENLLVGASVGIGSDLEERVFALIEAGSDVILVDSAHGFSKGIIEVVKLIKQKHPETEVIAGNIATANGAQALIDAGADAIRVGMGPGSICTTRIITGMGVPQITAIFEAVSVAHNAGIPVIADGGIIQSGDTVKALASGASTVMMGSLFAACEESPGEIVEINGKKYKSYRGMGSISAMEKGSAERYGQNAKKGKKMIAEGVEGLVPTKGTVQDFLDLFIGGLRSGMYYIGAKNIKEMWEKGKFIKITPASLTESHPHDILITETGGNYQIKK
ncbi:MAG: IMP dehydrogenase (Inosine-5'-monophosphate dehydrogenase) [Candidatus Gottesmanbacteria bacterium GW2011_GWC2_39_8]|uniref:IMP dehydrogenase (Inosine-5'-monophosphate dehydrogenase) n=1 Tax=Candidatus Gottesmanbacteria bacterium GW2011_GWC2_39_8 TaxID=1618450 RepID=A0A0G0PY44_9BACT|nr:MAG: IMP dehydrogenase (Inosine-5'-monophosphate dehydrogenase) [Candidatus Gottesmanbacteria bacterium GW2011_GWC2_39_8]